jgi:hypothetical protein
LKRTKLDEQPETEIISSRSTTMRANYSTLRTPVSLKHQRARALARAALPDLVTVWPVTSTSAVKNSSEKKSREPENTTRALFLALKPERNHPTIKCKKCEIIRENDVERKKTRQFFNTGNFT